MAELIGFKPDPDELNADIIFIQWKSLFILKVSAILLGISIEIFVGIYSWYCGKRVEPFTNRIAGFVNTWSLFMRLLKPIVDPVMDGIRKYVQGIEKTPQEQRIEALERENQQLKDLLRKRKKWFRRGSKPPQNERKEG